MAAQLPCDLCEQEVAVVLFNNLADGSSMSVGALCLPTFFGGAMLGAIGSDTHAGPPTKCQACRRVHERMTTPVAPLSITAEQGDQPPAEAADAAQAAGE
jgi:hypothetical protein